MGKFLQFFLFKQLLAAKGDDTICMKRKSIKKNSNRNGISKEFFREMRTNPQLALSWGCLEVSRLICVVLVSERYLLIF